MAHKKTLRFTTAEDFHKAPLETLWNAHEVYVRGILVHSRFSNVTSAGAAIWNGYFRR
jgi:hypothetical protein